MPAKTIHFTCAKLDNLPIPTEGEDVYRDSKIKELYLRVHPSGKKTFSLVAWMPSIQRTKREPIGTYPAVPPDLARNQAKKTLGMLAQGIAPSEQRRAERKRITFAALFDEYMERHGAKKKSAKEDRANFNRYLNARIGKKAAAAITRADLSELHRAITKQGIPVAANRALALISSVFGWAIDQGLCENNPAKGVRRNPEKSRDRFILPGELSAYFRAVDGEPNTTIRDYVRMSLDTGQRRSDVLAMKWSEIDFHTATWFIPDTKNGTPNHYPLSMSALNLLEARYANREGAFVFPGPGKSGHLVEPKSGWGRIKERMHCFAIMDALQAAGVAVGLWEVDPRLGYQPHQLRRDLEEAAQANDVPLPQIGRLVLHDLRRTNGSYQAMTGASLPIIGKSLNHQSPQSTAIYARLHSDAPRAAVESALAAMEQFAKAGPSRPISPVGPTDESREVLSSDAMG